jgi:hypothetical protein
MGRIHAFEWEDQSWFPNSWRDYGTNYLQFLANKLDIYKAIVPVVKKGLDESGKPEWVDIASGGGGGLLKLSEHLKVTDPELKITLTDFYPNEKAFAWTKKQGGEMFQSVSTPVDAMNVPESLHGKFRTMFGAFHHFRPEDGQKILQNAVDTNTPIAIFEPLSRNFMSFFSMLFVIPNVLLLTPFIRPFDWKVLPFIYLLPLIPLYVMWDGVVSCMRMYSEKELKSLISKLKDSDTFEWEVGKKKAGPMPVPYLIGYPKRKG